MTCPVLTASAGLAGAAIAGVGGRERLVMMVTATNAVLSFLNTGLPPGRHRPVKKTCGGSISGQQRLARAALGQLSIFKHPDRVCPRGAFEAVGHDQDRACIPLQNAVEDEG